MARRAAALRKKRYLSGDEVWQIYMRQARRLHLGGEFSGENSCDAIVTKELKKCTEGVQSDARIKSPATMRNARMYASFAQAMQTPDGKPIAINLYLEEESERS